MRSKKPKYIATSPQGETVFICSLAELCEQMNWNKKSAYIMFAQKRRYKGWAFEEIEFTEEGVNLSRTDPVKSKEPRYIATSPEGEVVLIETLADFFRQMNWNAHSARASIGQSCSYKGWHFNRYNPEKNCSQDKSQNPEILIDGNIISSLSSTQFVFRPYTVNDLTLYWEAYLPSDLTTPVASAIVVNPNGGFMWNCYNGCEAETRADVARKIMSALDPETI